MNLMRCWTSLVQGMKLGQFWVGEQTTSIVAFELRSLRRESGDSIKQKRVKIEEAGIQMKKGHRRKKNIAILCTCDTTIKDGLL